jgi:hypothetical protein
MEKKLIEHLFKMKQLLIIFIVLNFPPLLAQNKKATNEIIYTKVEQEPEYKGNFIELLREIRLTQDINFYSIIINFIVYQDGTIGNFKKGKILTTESLAYFTIFKNVLLKTNGQWIPAKNKGKKVAYWHTIKISCLLPAEEE